MSILRFEIPFFQALLILWADMLIRIAAHGLEQGVLSTVIDQAVARSFRLLEICLAVRVKVKERGSIR
jgi:hypothetical protein